jgi:hypothetical protein
MNKKDKDNKKKKRRRKIPIVNEDNSIMKWAKRE